MQGLKAPGPDGFQPKFYQYYWDIIAGSFSMFIQSVFSNWSFPRDLNKCFITLIPKIENPEGINQFRPITLCNVCYKVVIKILVQRLRNF